MMNFRKVAAGSDGAEIRRYLTQGASQREPVSAIDRAGRQLEPGERLTEYYTGRDERASWRPDMPVAVAAALGIKDHRQAARDAELDPLFEARRADNGAAWSEHQRKNSGFDFVFSPINLCRSRPNSPRRHQRPRRSARPSCPERRPALSRP